MIGAKSFMGFDSCFNLNAYTVFISNALIVCLHLRLHILLNTAINSPNIFVTIPSEITFFFFDTFDTFVGFFLFPVQLPQSLTIGSFANLFSLVSIE